MNAGPTDARTHTPYWYESFVGLSEVVDLLDEAKGIQSVELKVEGIARWDDVVVRFTIGRRRCYQVENTRAGNSLAFGDLVGADDHDKSLLSSLFESWQCSRLNDDLTDCILHTNREAGARWSATSTEDTTSVTTTFECSLVAGSPASMLTNAKLWLRDWLNTTLSQGMTGLRPKFSCIS